MYRAAEAIHRVAADRLGVGDRLLALHPAAEAMALHPVVTARPVALHPVVTARPVVPHPALRPVATARLPAGMVRPVVPHPALLLVGMVRPVALLLVGMVRLVALLLVGMVRLVALLLVGMVRLVALRPAGVGHPGVSCRPVLPLHLARGDLSGLAGRRWRPMGSPGTPS